MFYTLLRKKRFNVCEPEMFCNIIVYLVNIELYRHDITN